MAEWDPKSGKVRPTWTVRFSPWSIFVGCAIAAVITCGGAVRDAHHGPGLDELTDAGSVAQGGIFLLGLIFGIFLLAGTRAGVGSWLHAPQQHQPGRARAAFAALGLFVGFMIGNLVGLGSIVAPAAGIGAAVGRWAISSQAKI